MSVHLLLVLSLHTYCAFRIYLFLQTYYFLSVSKVEQNWATLQGGEMTIQTTQPSEATQAVASLAEAAVAASQEMQPGTTVTMALNRYSWEVAVKLGSEKQRKEILNRSSTEVQVYVPKGLLPEPVLLFITSG